MTTKNEQIKSLDKTSSQNERDHSSQLMWQLDAGIKHIKTFIIYYYSVITILLSFITTGGSLYAGICSTHRKKGLDRTEKESKWWLRNSWSGIWLPLHTELVCPWGQLRQLPQVIDCQGASAFVHCSSSSCSLEFKCKGNRMKKEVGRGSSPPVSSHLLICSISIFHLKSGKAKQ